MDDRSRVLMATIMGAVAGGVWGWLYLTESGRRVRDQIEPRLDDFMNELTRVRGTVEKARTAANEGWRSLSDMAGGEPSKLTSCPTGDMVGGPTRVPDELRKTLKLAPSADVEGIEPREKGWLGFSKLHYPTWAAADEAFMGKLVPPGHASTPGYTDPAYPVIGRSPRAA